MNMTRYNTITLDKQFNVLSGGPMDNEPVLWIVLVGAHNGNTITITFIPDETTDTSIEHAPNITDALEGIQKSNAVQGFIREQGWAMATYRTVMRADVYPVTALKQ